MSAIASLNCAEEWDRAVIAGFCPRRCDHLCVRSFVPESGHRPWPLYVPGSVSLPLTLILSLSVTLSFPSQDCGSVTGVTSAQCSLSLRVSECAPVSGFPRGGLPLSLSPVAAPSPCSQSHAPPAIRTGPSQPRAPGLPPPPGVSLPPLCFLACDWLVPLLRCQLREASLPVPDPILCPVSPSHHRLHVGLPCGPESQRPGGARRHWRANNSASRPHPLSAGLCLAPLPALCPPALLSCPPAPLRPPPSNLPGDLTRLPPGRPGAPTWPPGLLLPDSPLPPGLTAPSPRPPAPGLGPCAPEQDSPMSP